MVYDMIKYAMTCDSRHSDYKEDATMNGNSDHYLRKTQDMQTELRKLKKAETKYSNILCDIQREIREKEEQIKRSLHCYTLCSADNKDSVITE